jgi:hypothetical protein
MRHYGIHVMNLGAFTPIKYHHMPTGGTAPPVQSRQVQISSKPRRGKCIGPTSGFIASPDVGSGAIVGTLQTGYPCAQDISLVPQHRTLHPIGKGSGVAMCPAALEPLLVPKSSGIATCPVASGMPPDREGLRCHHVSHGSRPASQCGRALTRHMPPGPSPSREVLRCRHVFRESRPASRCRRALVSPRAPCHQARHPAGKGSDVAMCPAAPDPPLGAGGLWRRHMARGS